MRSTLRHSAKSAPRRHKPPSLLSPRKLERIYCFIFTLCLCIRSDGAWFYPVDATAVEVIMPGYVLFKALIFPFFLFEGLRGLHIAYTRIAKPTAVFTIICALFVMMLLVITFNATVRANSALDFQYVIGLFSMTFALISLHNRGGAQQLTDDFHKSMLIILTGSALLAILIPKFGQHAAIFSGQWRGLYAHKNGLGAGALWLFMISTYVYFKAAQKDRVTNWLYAYSVGLSLMCAAFALSGTSLTVLVVAAGVVGYVAAMNRIVYVTQSGMNVIQMAKIGIFVVGGALIYLNLDTIKPLIFQTLNKDTTFSGRTEVWHYLLAEAMQKPIWGHGLNFLNDESYRESLRSVTFGSIRSTHNSYLGVFLDLGLVGLSLQLGAYILVAFLWISSPRTDRLLDYYAMPVLISLAIYNNFESNNTFYTGMGTTLLYLCLVLIAMRPPVKKPARRVKIKVPVPA